MTPIGRPRGEERDVEPAAGAEAPGRLLVDLGIVEERVDPLGAAGARARGRSSSPPARAASRRSRPRPSPSAASIRSVPSPAGQRDRDQPRADQLAQAPGDQLEQSRELDLARQRRPDLVQRLELDRPARSPPRTGARSRSRPRPGSQASRRAPRPLGVNEPSLLLRQVEVPERTAAKQDRHAEEAAHRRMVGREADGARIVGDRLEPQRPGVGDQRAEDAATARKVADPRRGLGVDAGVDEALEPRPGLGRSRRAPRSARRSGAAAVSASFCSRSSSESSELSAMPASTSPRRRSVSARVLIGPNLSDPRGPSLDRRRQRGYTRHSRRRSSAGRALHS